MNKYVQTVVTVIVVAMIVVTIGGVWLVCKMNQPVVEQTVGDSTVIYGHRVDQAGNQYLLTADGWINDRS